MACVNVSANDERGSYRSGTTPVLPPLLVNVSRAVVVGPQSPFIDCQVRSRTL